jgi:hypothetical protein
LGAQQIGTEVGDQLRLVGRAHDLEFVQVVSDGGHIVGLEHHANGVPGLRSPTVARPVHPPSAIHTQVGVQRYGSFACFVGRPVALAQAQQQVFAVAGRFGHRPAFQADRGQLRHAKIGAGQLLAGKAGLEHLRGHPNGVALWHGPILPQSIKLAS